MSLKLVTGELKRLIVYQAIEKTLYDSFMFLPEEIDTATAKANLKTKAKIKRQLSDEYFSAMLSELESQIGRKKVDLNIIIMKFKIDTAQKIELLKTMDGSPLPLALTAAFPADFTASIKKVSEYRDLLVETETGKRAFIKAESILKAILDAQQDY